MKPAAVSLVAVLTLVGARAQAEPREPDTDRAAQAQSSRAGAFEHDGFYLRLGLGFGGFSEGMSSEHDDPAQGTVNGVSSVGEIMVGGTVAPRFVVGGGLWTSTVLVSEFTQTGGDDVPDDLRQPGNFTIAGPFADWYFGSAQGRREAGGFHAQGGLGVAVLNGMRPGQMRHADDRVAVGAGVMLGFGYEWWVHEQWGLGVLARLTAAGLIENDERDDTWYHGVATFPAFLFSATYN